MEELQKIAKAYYDRASEEHRESARQMFRLFDENRDGKICFQEFKKQAGYWDPNGYYFKQIDENKNGTLDFNEFLVYFFICKAGFVLCNGCRQLMTGNYFSCLICLGTNSFDLCCNCFAGGKIYHQHGSDKFLDSHARTKLLRDVMKNAQITLPQTTNTNGSAQRSISLGGVAQAFQAFNIAYNVGTAIVHIGSFATAVGCSIM